MHKKIKWLYYVIITCALIILILPVFIRAVSNQPLMAGEEPYYHARISSEILRHGLSTEDTFAYFGREYRINPYHLLLGGFSYLLGVINASIVLPILLGLLSLFLFYKILKKLGSDNLTTFFSLLIFLLSPLFVTIFSFSSSNALIIFLLLLGFWLYTNKKKWCFAFSLVIFIILSSFGIMPTIISILSILLYSIVHKKNLQKSYLLIAVLFIIVLSYHLPFYLNSPKIDFVDNSLFTDFIVDLGGLWGFSVFMIVLSIIGFYSLWIKNRKYRILLLFILFTIIYSFFNNNAVIYTNFLVVFLSGASLKSLTVMHWKLSQVRAFTLTILFCGLVLSLFSHIFLLSEMLPNRELVEGLSWIKERASKEGIIFSHYSNGFWIEYFTGRPVFMDSLFDGSQNVNQLYSISEEIFGSNNLEHTRNLLTRQQISYIVITENMYQGLVWDKKQQGLAFLLRNNETFKKRYSNSFIDVTEYIYEGQK